ncbi:Uncharacterised protein [Segatella copri]|nr:Uncharacterised protein [Segatella copri]
MVAMMLISLEAKTISIYRKPWIRDLLRKKSLSVL